MSNIKSMSLIHPDKIFSNVSRVPLPRPWPDVISPTPTIPVRFQWQESEDNRALVIPLEDLQMALRSVHKRKVTWPADESYLSGLSPSEYLRMLLQPIADLFNQLCISQHGKTPVGCISVDLGDSIYGATFTAEVGNGLDPLMAPIIVSLVRERLFRWPPQHNTITNQRDELFDSEGGISLRVEYALSKSLEYKPGVSTIIVTNFQDIAVFSPPGKSSPEPCFKKVVTTQPILALRVLATAILEEEEALIDVPGPGMEIDEEPILPKGPPIDPNQPLSADEQLFETYHRHSDFDLVTLIRDHARAQQFFRWKEKVQRRYSKVVAHPNDTLSALTNQVGLIIPDFHPVHPYEASEIPLETAKHLTTIRRESPLMTAGLDKILEQSECLTLKIQNILSEGSPRTMCTVYQCEITSIDNKPVSSPSLCLKLFDDRFQMLRSPYDGAEEADDSLFPWWFTIDHIFQANLIAEPRALNEALAYEKLRPVQGTVIPWFYGIHQFTLQDGMVLYGLLMEYIEGWTLVPDAMRKLSADRQIDMIQSCRHAARVLDVAGVGWHSGQILLHTNPKTKRDHAVLIDFASTTQTWEPDKLNYIANYCCILRVLLGEEINGSDTELVWKHYGEPDDWDPLCASFGLGEEIRIVQARDMFPYITIG